MAQGQRLTDWQIETLRLAYAETGNAAHAAREAGCSATAAKRYVTQALADPNDGLDELRREKKADVVKGIHAVRLVLLAAMADPGKIAKASLSEITTSFGILTDKEQLLSGEATSRTENRTYDASRLTPDDREQLTRLRDKLAGKVTT